MKIFTTYRFFSQTLHDPTTPILSKANILSTPYNTLRQEYKGRRKSNTSLKYFRLVPIETKDFGPYIALASLFLCSPSQYETCSKMFYFN